MENRIPTPIDLLMEPPKDISTTGVTYDHIIPNIHDDIKLRNEFKTLIGRDLLKYCENLKWMNPFILKYLPHMYDKEIQIKSNVVRNLRYSIFNYFNRNKF